MSSLPPHDPGDDALIEALRRGLDAVPAELPPISAVLAAAGAAGTGAAVGGAAAAAAAKGAGGSFLARWFAILLGHKGLSLLAAVGLATVVVGATVGIHVATSGGGGGVAGEPPNSPVTAPGGTHATPTPSTSPSSSPSPGSTAPTTPSSTPTPSGSSSGGTTPPPATPTPVPPTPTPTPVQVAATVELSITEWSGPPDVVIEETVTVVGTPGGPTPTGTVSIDLAGVTLPALTLVDGVATTAIPTLDLPAGEHLVEFTYNGDATYLPASASLTVTITGVPG